MTDGRGFWRDDLVITHMSLYDLYKPLRNRCRELELKDALYVIWAYAQYLQFKDFKIPPEIEVSPVFLQAKIPQRFVSEWELESLTREIVLHACSTRGGKRSLKKASHFSIVVNSLKKLEEKVTKDFVNQENVIIEMNRIANRQFVWQENPPHANTIVRYYKIFSFPGVEEVVLRKTGLTVKDILYVGMALLGAFLKHPAIKAPIKCDFAVFTSEKFEAFADFTSATLDDLKKKIAGIHVVDENIAYAYNDLRERPMISMTYRGDSVLFCPLPTLLFWRMTGGLYYEICAEPDFSGPFGDSFESFVGDVLNEATKNDDRFSVLPEEKYGSKKQRKHTVDWILAEGNDAAIFVECKTKRLSWKSKIALTDMDAVEHDLNYVASAVVQLYKTIEDY